MESRRGVTPRAACPLPRHSPLEITPHKARVVGDETVRALVAFLDVAAQSGSAAGADVPESFPLL
jgi:hypothetical protein